MEMDAIEASDEPDYLPQSSTSYDFSDELELYKMLDKSRTVTARRCL